MTPETPAFWLLDCDHCHTLLCVIARLFPLVNAGLLVVLLVLCWRLLARAGQARTDALEKRRRLDAR